MVVIEKNLYTRRSRMKRQNQGELHAEAHDEFFGCSGDVVLVEVVQLRTAKGKRSEQSP